MRALALAISFAGCSAGHDSVRLPDTPVAVAAPPPAVLTAVDRAELAQIVALPDGVIALTAAGDLVRYDAGLARTAERTAALAAITATGARVYGVQRDGALVAIDARTLEPTVIVAGGAAGARWLAATRDELLIATDDELVRVALGDHAVTRIAIPRADRPGRPGSWLLDRERASVWFGSDGGEWGGSVGRIDLAAGRATLGASGEDVYGIVRLPDGRVLAHGGLAHLGSIEAYIASVDDALVVTPVWRRRARPISAIVPRGDELIVLSAEDVFAVSADLARWTHVAKIPAPERGGRPDAMSSYPAVAAVVAGPAGSVWLATRHDGLFVLRGTTLARVERVE